MAGFSFDGLCEGVCGIFEMPPPDLTRNEHGNACFWLELDAVPFTLIHYGGRPDHVHLIVTLGALPEHLLLAGCRALLNANMLLLGVDAQAFGRDLDTGDCTLRCAYPLAALTPAALVARLQALSQMANRWRADPFVDDPVAPCGQAKSQHSHTATWKG